MKATQSNPKAKPIAFLIFNKKIAEETLTVGTKRKV